MYPSGKDHLDLLRLILRKLNIKFVDIKVGIRIFVIAKVIVEARQVINSILPHNEFVASANP